MDYNSSIFKIEQYLIELSGFYAFAFKTSSKGKRAGLSGLAMIYQK